MRTLLLLLILAAGAGLTLQVGMNAALRTAFGETSLASLANFIIGLLGLTLFCLATGVRLPNRSSLLAAPGWAWWGGLFGAFYVAISTVAGPRVGAATLLALTVLGQLLTSLLVDHYGLLGFERNPLSPSRLIGGLLLLAGVWLVSRR